MTAGLVNFAVIDVPQRKNWVLIDTGLPTSAGSILNAVTQRYGERARPSCIVLTHGHFDHAGSVQRLAELWDVLVYAHHFEKPFLTGKSSYPPFDPTAGGLVSQIARFFPRSPHDLGYRFRELPANGELDDLPGWEILHTPGHTAGHVSLFRQEDGVLLAGDAFSTVDQQSLAKTMVQYPEFALPPVYATTDWKAAQESVGRLAALRPATILTGHGRPIYGDNTAAQLEKFAREFIPPRHGRYVRRPAVTNESGVVELPPPVPDRVPKIAAAFAIGGAAAMTTYLIKRHKAA